MLQSIINRNSQARPEAVKAWEALDVDEQRVFVARIVRTWCKNIIGKSADANAYNRISESWLWERFGASFDELENSVWARLLPYMQDGGRMVAEIDRKRAEAGKAPLTAAGLVYRAANAGLMQLYRAEIKHGRALSLDAPTGESDDGSAATLSDALGCVDAGYTEAETAAAARQLARDAVDLLIIAEIMRGGTERSAAAVAGMSCVAVHKRIKRMASAAAGVVA